MYAVFDSLQMVGKAETTPSAIPFDLYRKGRWKNEAGVLWKHWKEVRRRKMFPVHFPVFPSVDTPADSIKEQHF